MIVQVNTAKKTVLVKGKMNANTMNVLRKLEANGYSVYVAV